MILSSFPIKVKVTTKSLYYENFAKKLNNPFNDKKKMLSMSPTLGQKETFSKSILLNSTRC